MARYEESRSTRDFYFGDQNISLGEATTRGGKFTYHWPGDYKAIIKYNAAVGNDRLKDINTYKGWAYGYTHGTNLTCQDFTNDEVYLRDSWGATHLFVRWDHGDEGHTATTENAADLPFMNYAGEVHPGRHQFTGANMQIYMKWQPKYTGRVRIRGMVFDGHKSDMYNTTDPTGVNWWIAKMVGNPTTLAGGASIWRKYHDGGNTRLDGIGSFDFEEDVTANQSDWYMLCIGPDGEQAYDTTPVEMMIEYVDPPVLQDVSLKENLIDNARWYTILPGWEDSDGNWQQGSGKGTYLYPENPSNNPIDASLGAWRSSYIMPSMALIGWDSNTFVMNALNCPPEVVLGWNFYDLIENATVADFTISTTGLHRARTVWPYANPFAGSTLEMRTPGYSNRRMFGSMLPYEYRWFERGGGLNYSQWPHHVRSSFNTGTQGFTVGAAVTHDLGTSTNFTLPADAGPFGVNKNIGTAYKFSDWGGDIFDGWGHWWVQPEGSEPIAIPLPNTTASDATNYTTRVWQGTLNGTTFEIKYGYGAQGIWRVQIVAGDHSEGVTNGSNNKFRVGTYGDLGSGSSTKTQFGRDGLSHNGTVAESVSIYYDQWWQNGSPTERHYHYVVPFNVSDNLHRPYATGQSSLGNSYMYTDWLTHGVTLYISKQNNVINWVENDLDFYQDFYSGAVQLPWIRVGSLHAPAWGNYNGIYHEDMGSWNDEDVWIMQQQRPNTVIVHDGVSYGNPTAEATIDRELIAAHPYTNKASISNGLGGAFSKIVIQEDGDGASSSLSGWPNKDWLAEVKVGKQLRASVRDPGIGGNVLASETREVFLDDTNFPRSNGDGWFFINSHNPAAGHNKIVKVNSDFIITQVIESADVWASGYGVP